VADLTSDLASLKIQREVDPNRPKWGRIVVLVSGRRPGARLGGLRIVRCVADGVVKPR